MDESERLSSKLGTKEHWDSVYEREGEEFSESGCIGEVWFEEYTGDGKLTEFLCEVIGDFVLPDIQTPALLDLGTGNGALLLEMHEEMSQVQLYGCDYSLPALSLAKSILKEKEVPGRLFPFDVLAAEEDQEPSIEVEHAVSGDHEQLSLDKAFHVVHDKGTLDAIWLNKDNDLNAYVATLMRVMHDGGIFVITSCNLTREELLGVFGEHLEIARELKYRTISFGGVQGATITTLALQKK